MLFPHLAYRREQASNLRSGKSARKPLPPPQHGSPICKRIPCFSEARQAAKKRAQAGQSSANRRRRQFPVCDQLRKIVLQARRGDFRHARFTRERSPQVPQVAGICLDRVLRQSSLHCAEPQKFLHCRSKSHPRASDSPQANVPAAAWIDHLGRFATLISGCSVILGRQRNGFATTDLGGDANNSGLWIYPESAQMYGRVQDALTKART